MLVNNCLIMEKTETGIVEDLKSRYVIVIFPEFILSNQHLGMKYFKHSKHNLNLEANLCVLQRRDMFCFRTLITV